jgi:hypothetical protein
VLPMRDQGSTFGQVPSMPRIKLTKSAIDALPTPSSDVVCDRSGLHCQRLSKNRSVAEISRVLRREVGRPWAGRSIHELTKRDVVEVVSAVTARRGELSPNRGFRRILRVPDGVARRSIWGHVVCRREFLPSS